MRITNILLGSFLLYLLPCCNNKEENKIPEPPEGSIGLSELETKHDYYLPFAIENNSGALSSALLNGKQVAFPDGGFLEFTENGFYELIIKHSGSGQPDDTFLFTTTTEEREASEWGISAWVPVAYKTVPLGNETVEILYPRRFTDVISVPFMFYIRDAGNLKDIYCQGICKASGDTFNIKQGVGSVSIDASFITDKAEFSVGGKKISINLTRISQPGTVLSGTINTPLEISANSFVRISGNLDISSTGSLTVAEGCILLVDEAADINLYGPVIFSGTHDNPVVVTSGRNKYWGGFITRMPGGTVNASYTIFCQSGYHDSEGYDWGHAGRQALFYTENSSLTLDHCYMTDHIGQIFYPLNSILTFDNILVQRAKTGGQINNSSLILRNSVFTDFPEESDVFIDSDNDALYLDATDATIENTIFMYAKDDGLDSGAGEGGEVTVSDCRFEACFHEGAALSSINPAIKRHTFTRCIFTNCGQGLELGYSSTEHTVVADNCLFLSNGIGIRYGDNYDWSEVDGKMSVRNSLSALNIKDVWNMVRMTWNPKLDNLTFENMKVSKFCPQYPYLEIINK